nr:zinc finger protein 660-like [Chelonoidis abingdonii]
MKDPAKRAAQKTHMCPECGKSFSKKGNLKRHQRIHTAEELYPCGECGRRFTTRGHLTTHQSIHTGERPFQCDECGRCFRLEICLAAHQKTHTKGGPYICVHCGKSLSTRIYFSIHMRTHKEKRPYACTECGKSFVKKGTLTAHKEIHKRDKPFKCSDCSRCFGQSATLVAHQKIHLRGGPFICTECGKSLSTKRYFNVHQRNHAKQRLQEATRQVNGMPLRVIQIKEEPDVAFKQEDSFSLGKNVTIPGAHSEDGPQEGTDCGTQSNPKILVSTPWGIQTKEEPDIYPEHERNITVADQNFYIKEEPQASPGYDNQFNPKMPLFPPWGIQATKEAGVDNEHQRVVTMIGNHAACQKPHIKEEPQESTDHGSNFSQKTSLGTIQRIQIKEGAGADGEHGESCSPKKKHRKRQRTSEEGTPGACTESRANTKCKKNPLTKDSPKAERIFPCPECGKSFNQKSNLTRHRKIHTSEGPYK